MYLCAPLGKYVRVAKSISKAEFSIVGTSIEVKTPTF
jgi:hypothetical protein